MTGGRTILAGVLAVAVEACGSGPDDGADGSNGLRNQADRGASVAPYPDGGFGFGQAPESSRIVAWDIDVMPDGTGLPPGSGTVARGAEVYRTECAACHGATGTEGPDDVLVGREPREGFPFGRDITLTRTIGNYWPYATTLDDYINRAMPQTAPGSLEPDEVYSLVAFLLHRNEIIPEDAVIDAETLPAVVMPARDRFVRDNRLESDRVR